MSEQHRVVDGTSTDESDEFTRFVHALTAWVDALPAWPPAASIAKLWQEVGPRLAASLDELGRPLVVGVLGGTGTGKSTLVNALAGRDVTEASDVARPTTVRPVLVAAAGADLSWFPADAIGAEVVPTDAAAVAEIVLVDCPDPDTQGDAQPADEPSTQVRAGDPRNLDRLEQILPLCDVLMVVSTAQKYRSFRVARELAAFAPGRPLLFVQTHASRDPDIREDWKQDLERQGFVVPTIYRVDGREAFRQALRGEPVDPAFAELQAAIAGELACRGADRLRRNGALELAGWFLDRCNDRLEPIRGPLDELVRGVSRETQRLERLLVDGIARQLRQSRLGWRQLAGRELEQQWQGGAFGWFLQLVRQVAGWLPKGRRQISGLVGRTLVGQLPSLTLAAAGSTAADNEPLGEALGLDDAEVEQSRSVLAGLARRAAIEGPAIHPARLQQASEDPAVAMALERAQRWMTAGIRKAASGCRDRLDATWLRVALEVLFDAVLVAVLLRAAWDFFHGRLWLGESRGGLLTEAIVWLVLWGLALRQAAIAWAARGLEHEIKRLAASLREADLVQPLLSDVATSAQLAEGVVQAHQRHQETSRLLAATISPSRKLSRLMQDRAIVAGPASPATSRSHSGGG